MDFFGTPLVRFVANFFRRYLHAAAMNLLVRRRPGWVGVKRLRLASISPMGIRRDRRDKERANPTSHDAWTIGTS